MAHNLAASGDTMEMMQAVLDTNFWLATHVVVVTIGYSATFLAGFIAIFYVLGGVCTRLLAGDAMKALPKMIYGVICFAALASWRKASSPTVRRAYAPPKSCCEAIRPPNLSATSQRSEKS